MPSITFAIAIAALSAPVGAQGPAVHAIVHVDVIPDDKPAGSAILVDYLRRARRDPDVRTITLIEEARIPNHFMLDESFADEAAYRRFVARPFVRRFRAALFPHLGSPWDERLGTEVGP